MPQQINPNPSSRAGKTTLAYYHGFQARVEIDDFHVIFASVTAGQVYSVLQMSLPQARELAQFIVEYTKKVEETNG